MSVRGRRDHVAKLGSELPRGSASVGGASHTRSADPNKNVSAHESHLGKDLFSLLARTFFSASGVVCAFGSAQVAQKIVNWQPAQLGRIILFSQCA